jgi:protein SCO1/2
VVGDFVRQIDPAITGLTGTPEEVAAAAKAYKVFYRKADDDPQYYLMDHSSFTYLVAPKTGFLEFYSSEMSPEDLASSVACFADKL